MWRHCVWTAPFRFPEREAAAQPNPGRTETIHRLNRSEYHNAIRELLDLDIDVTTLLPADDVPRNPTR